jgi:hypothetical protein
VSLDGHLRKQLRQALGTLAGQECIAALGGAGTGWNISLHFGDRIVRQPLLTNPQLTPAERVYEGRFGLFIECSWRLSDSSSMITASGDAVAGPERMSSRLERLVGHRIVSAYLADRFPDFELRFDDDLCLAVFCCNSETDNYSYFGEHQVLIVGEDGRLRKEAP